MTPKDAYGNPLGKGIFYLSDECRLFYVIGHNPDHPERGFVLDSSLGKVKVGEVNSKLYRLTDSALVYGVMTGQIKVENPLWLKERLGAIEGASLLAKLEERAKSIVHKLKIA